MTQYPEVVTPEIIESELADGSKIYTATLKELPGVVCDGVSEKDAMSELVAVLNSIRERMGLSALGLSNQAVGWWSWDGYVGGSRVSRYGSQETDHRPVDHGPAPVADFQRGSLQEA